MLLKQFNWQIDVHYDDGGLYANMLDLIQKSINFKMLHQLALLGVISSFKRELELACNASVFVFLLSGTAVDEYFIIEEFVLCFLKSHKRVCAYFL